MTVERFVGKVVKFEIDGKEYIMKSPPAKVIPRFLSLQGKDPKNFTSDDWGILTDTIMESIKKTYPDWSEEDIDEFVVQNLNILQEKLPIAMGWMSEEEVKKFAEEYASKTKDEEDS